MALTRREFTLLAGAAALTSTFSTRAFAKGESDDLASLSLTAAAAKIRAGTVTSTQLTQACLDRIATYDSKLDAFITVMKGK
ncbi:MAG: amidase, partial [Steroidobacteraceae bacterium]